MLLAIASLCFAGPLSQGWSTPTRTGTLVGLAVLFLLAHSRMAPATLSYALMLDLRRRDRQWLEEQGRGGRQFVQLLAKARWVDLTLPFALTLLLFAAAWLALEALAGAGAREVRAWRALEVAATLVLVAVPLTVLLPGRGATAGESFSRLGESLVQGSVALLRPFLAPVAWLAERLLQRLGDEPAVATLPEDDLADVIEVGSHQGDLSILQSQLLLRELSFSHRTAGDVMVPRVRVEYLDVEMTFEEAKRRVCASRFSRFPVQSGSVDRIVAILHVKTLLGALLGEAPPTLGALLERSRPRPPVHVAHDQPLDEVLAVLQREHASLAVVDDAYGGVAGILTVEDVVEELVGEIADESDPEIVIDSLSFSGRRTLGELAEEGVELPGEDDQTVADFLTERLGESVAEGASWEGGGVRLTVETVDADGHIETVRAERHLRPDENGG